MEPESEWPDVDVSALQEKYAEERRKRLRPEGVGQYQKLSAFADFDTDPHADPEFTRAPVVEDVDVLIIGGGFGGLLAAGHLRQAGIESLRIVEKGADFGGTWYWNRYPGAACDVESYIYLPLLEELGVVPSEKYAKGPEIFAHCQKVAAHYGLYEGALFQTLVKELRWDEARSRWIVRTNRDDEIAARFVVSATGLMSSPKLPGIPGIEAFAGHRFHTSRWDYRYTGGDPGGNMTGLNDKIVGIIGTGSTSLQCVPHLAESSKHLYVFQRTPSTVSVRGNRPTDPEWARSLKPGWQRERMRNFTYWAAGIPQDVDMVDDGWTELFGATTRMNAGKLSPEEVARADAMRMEKIRRRVDEVVRDKATAEALKPWYNLFCKRFGFHDEFLDTFNRPNVTLVDTAGKGVERITPAGVVVAGREYPLDCLIFATGFDFMTNYTEESGIEIFGRSGRPLTEHWTKGARTVWGIQTAGFPNFFLMSQVHAGVTPNYMHTADVQTQHIAYIISRCMTDSVSEIEPSEEMEQNWVDTILEFAPRRQAFIDNCTPSYGNNEGKRDGALMLNGVYAGGPTVYLKILEDWRAEGSMQGMQLTY
jgi:cyclohexanone monooxygenase